MIHNLYTLDTIQCRAKCYQQLNYSNSAILSGATMLDFSNWYHTDQYSNKMKYGTANFSTQAHLSKIQEI